MTRERILDIAIECRIPMGEPDGNHYITDTDCSKVIGECEYCEGDIDNRKALLVASDDIYIDGNGNITSGWYEKKINYCPMCGRKLGE